MGQRADDGRWRLTLATINGKHAILAIEDGAVGREALLRHPGRDEPTARRVAGVKRLGHSSEVANETTNLGARETPSAFKLNCVKAPQSPGASCTPKKTNRSQR